jgi:hypothetical protein
MHAAPFPEAAQRDALDHLPAASRSTRPSRTWCRSAPTRQWRHRRDRCRPGRPAVTPTNAWALPPPPECKRVAAAHRGFRTIISSMSRESCFSTIAGPRMVGTAPRSPSSPKASRRRSSRRGTKRATGSSGSPSPTSATRSSASRISSRAACRGAGQHERCPAKAAVSRPKRQWVTVRSRSQPNCPPMIPVSRAGP